MKTADYEQKTVKLQFIEKNQLLMRGVKLDGEEFQELQRSIARHGILQPILLQPIAEDANGNMKYAVTNGMQRYTACVNLGYDEIPAMIMRSNEIESLVRQITTNKQTVPTKRAEYGHALRLIIARQPTATMQDLAHMTGQTEDWIEKTLLLTKLKKEVAEFLEANKAPIANQLKLVEIPDNDQDGYKDAACKMSAADFAGQVRAYKKAVQEARKGQPKVEPTWTPTPHLRSVKELVELMEAPDKLPHVDGHKLDLNTLRFVTKMDKASLAASEATFKARQEQIKADAEKAKAEREKSKLLSGKA